MLAEIELSSGRSSLARARQISLSYSHVHHTKKLHFIFLFIKQMLTSCQSSKYMVFKWRSFLRLNKLKVHRRLFWEWISEILRSIEHQKPREVHSFNAYYWPVFKLGDPNFVTFQSDNLVVHLSSQMTYCKFFTYLMYFRCGVGLLPAYFKFTTGSGCQILNFSKLSLYVKINENFTRSMRRCVLSSHFRTKSSPECTNGTVCMILAYYFHGPELMHFN